jgi:hypothetical protein
MNVLEEHELISLICVGEAGDPEWEAFERLAAANPGLWRDLAEAQRDQAALSAAVAGVMQLADRVELPFDRGTSRHVGKTSDARWEFPRLGAWSGWAVAATVGAAWLIGLQASTPLPPTSANAGLVDLASLSSDDLLRSYVDRGRASGEVIGEIPTRVLLDARPAPSGTGYDVLYLRQMLEQTHVPELYHLGGQDERGRSSLVRYSPNVRRPL